MGKTRRLLEVGPVSVDVPAVASVRFLRGGRFAAWSSGDLVTLTVGRYSLSVTEKGMLVLRKYEAPPQ
jgi:hypothetical protein